MPKRVPQPVNLIGWMISALQWLPLLVLAWIWPGGWFFVVLMGILFAVYWTLGVADARRRRHLMNDRKGESLCTFVREFEVRRLDTWILRAVYEQFQPLAGFPIRRSDRLTEDLGLDDDDLCLMILEIAKRTGRSLGDWTKNQNDRGFETIDEIVSFFHAQPTEPSR